MTEETGSEDESESSEAASERAPSIHRRDRFLGVDDAGDPLIDWTEDHRNGSRETDSERGQWKRSPRSPFQRDRDRILYTPYFRRLKNVTQVARAGEAYLYHDRLSHSLKVAQVGRSLAELFLERQHTVGDIDDEMLRLPQEKIEDEFVMKKLPNLDERLDPTVVETAALAHDMGHPPFGHRIENTLDDLVDEYRDGLPDDPDDCETDSEDQTTGEDDDVPFGYEGNAQTLRIVAKLAQSGPESIRTEEYMIAALEGLHLTRASLNAVIKYPNSPAKNDDKYGYYPRTEAEVFDFARKLGPADDKTIEAAIMDYADDVTYAIHDMTDFYEDGRLPLHTLLNEAFELRQATADRDDISVDDYTLKQVGRPDEFPNTPEIDRVVEYLIGLDVSDQEIDKIPSPPEIVDVFIELGEMWPEPLNQNSLTPFRGTPPEDKNLDLFVSELITRYLDTNEVRLPKVAVQKRDDSDEDEATGYKLQLQDEIELQVWLLRKLTDFYVLRDTALMGQQRGEEEIIRELYDALYREVVVNTGDLGFSAIAEPFCTWLEDWESPDEMSEEMYWARVTADIIASLTERQAIRLYGRLTGETPGSLQDPIV